jgi:hypothetical protein
VTCIDDTRLAISNGIFQQINIIHIASKKIETIINSIWFSEHRSTLEAT